MTLADKLTLSRLIIAPLAVAGYLLLPMQWYMCCWAVIVLGALAEITDGLDGVVARRRKEVSDFGKLADPFCDVIYRISLLFAMMLPAGGVGISIVEGSQWWGQLVFHTNRGPIIGYIPWLPVFLMLLRELLVGALRAVTAAKGVVLAARGSGKVKATLQGIAIIAPPSLTVLFSPAGLWQPQAWQANVGYVLAWVACALSLGSISQYLWDNRKTLRTMMRKG